MAVFCDTFSNKSASDRKSGVVRHCRRHGPSITYKITPCWVTLLQHARRAAVLGQTSSLRPHWPYVRVCSLDISVLTAGARLLINIAYRSRIHERTISMRFLGIILRVLRHEVSVNNILQYKPVQTTFAEGGGVNVQ
jgi:hypothetical protein